MQIEELEIGKIKPYEKNPRKNDAAVNGVAESIKQFGFKQPIVIDKHNVIVAGHTRYKAAKKLGLATVPCVRADDLTKEQVKAYRIADNKLNELATWDFIALDEELASFDFDFEPFEFEMPEFNFSEAFEPTNMEQAQVQIAPSSGKPSETAPSEIKSDAPETIFEASNHDKTNEQDDSSIRENATRYGVYVEVDSEEAQRELVERLTKEGYAARTATI